MKRMARRKRGMKTMTRMRRNETSIFTGGRVGEDTSIN